MLKQWRLLNALSIVFLHALFFNAFGCRTWDLLRFFSTKRFLQKIDARWRERSPGKRGQVRRIGDWAFLNFFVTFFFQEKKVWIKISIFAKPNKPQMLKGKLHITYDTFVINMMSSRLLYTSGITNPYTKVCRIFMVLRFAIEKSTGLSFTFSSLPTAINPTRRIIAAIL